MHCLHTVSYTHLDVYKRQGYESGGMFYRFTGRSEYLQNIMAVSYTHLDVYKRQVQTILRVSSG